MSQIEQILTPEVEEKLLEAVNNNKEEAENLIEDKDKLEEYLKTFEEKLSKIKGIGKSLSEIPILISLVRAYIKGEYTQIPIASIIAVVAALLYLLNVQDIIPDYIPVVGFADDAAVVLFVLKMISVDLEIYKEWRDKNT